MKGLGYKASMIVPLLHIGISVAFLSTINCASEGSPVAHQERLQVGVDPTMELFSIIHRLARTGQDATNELPGYIQDIEKYFEPYRNHPAVSLMKRLWETHRINVSALATLVVYLDALPDLSPRNSLDRLPSELDSRWTADVIPELLDAARDFSRETKFLEFFHRQQQLYDASTANLRESLDDEHMLAWFQSYFGYRPNSFSIIVGMQTGWGNYGASMTRRDGTSEFFSIIGAHSPFLWSDVPRFSRSEVTPIVVHEFCHSYVNPWVSKHVDLLTKAGEQLYPHHQGKLSKIGCLYWNHMMNEYIVRACVLRYFAAIGDKKSVNRQIQYDERQGFFGIQELANAFEEYEKNRKTYPDLNSFFPRIANHFEDFAQHVRNKERDIE